MALPHRVTARGAVALPLVVPDIMMSHKGPAELSMQFFCFGHGDARQQKAKKGGFQVVLQTTRGHCKAESNKINEKK